MAVVLEEVSTEAASSEAAGLGTGYRPHLDGLRAVAVYLVVLFHAGVDRFSGGFIGVDVFFVLSGYLVTQLLVRDLMAHGTVRLGRFYARRIRRLLPAALVVLLVTCVVYSALASPAEVATAVNAFKASFLYVANWFFIDQSADYFATDIDANPVVHFWSLSVEEQFYFIWPLLLSGLFVVTRRLRDHARRALQVAVGVGALMSLLWALTLEGTNLNRAYYGTDARAYQLLAGASLALAPGLLRRASRYRAVKTVASLALAVLLVLSTSLIDVGAISRGIATAITTVVLILAIESSRGGPVNRLLSCGPAVYLGKISYGTYLWHWPVILVTLDLTDSSPRSTFAIAALVATGLASLSYHILERPIREQRFLDRVSPAVIALGLSMSVVAALVIIPSISDSSRSSATAALNTKAGFTPVPDLDFQSARRFIPDDLKGVRFVGNCADKPSATCTIIKGTGKHVLVIGDSHAGMMIPMFAKIARTQNLTLSTATTGGCPWQRNLYLANKTAEDQLRTKDCLAMKPDLYERVIPELAPDIIVAVSNDYLTRRPGVVFNESNKPIPAKNPEVFRQQFKAETERSIEELGTLADKLLILEPVPVTDPEHDPLICLTESEVLEACRFVSNPGRTAVESMYSELVDNEHSYVANFDQLLCPFDPICDPVIDGRIVRFDNQHITPDFAVALAGDVTTYLQDTGLIPS